MQHVDTLAGGGFNYGGAAAVVVFCRRSGRGCRIGAVVLCVASLLLALNAAVVR